MKKLWKKKTAEERTFALSEMAHQGSGPPFTGWSESFCVRWQPVGIGKPCHWPITSRQPMPRFTKIHQVPFGPCIRCSLWVQILHTFQNIGVNSLPFWLLQILKKNCNKQLAVEDTVGRRVFSLQLTLSTQALGLWMARPKLQEDLATNLRWPATNSWYSWYKKMGFLMPRLPPDFHQGDFSKIRTIGCKHSPRSKCWVDDLLFAGSLGHLLWASQKKYNQHARSTHFQRVAWGMER